MRFYDRLETRANNQTQFKRHFYLRVETLYFVSLYSLNTHLYFAVLEKHVSALSEIQSKREIPDDYVHYF